MCKFARGPRTDIALGFWTQQLLTPLDSRLLPANCVITVHQQDNRLPEGSWVNIGSS